MDKVRFGIIGVGNMGSAVAKAVCRSVGPKNILLCGRTPEKVQALAEQLFSADMSDYEKLEALAKYIDQLKDWMGG